jgi:hypothetical protein
MDVDALLAAVEERFEALRDAARTCVASSRSTASPRRCRSASLTRSCYKDRTDPGRLFGYCLTRAGSKEFFIRKAIG